MKDGLLRRHTVSEEGEPALRIVVPRHGRGPTLTSSADKLDETAADRLMRRFHHICHRGHRPLYDSLKDYYWWPHMEADCRDFTNACTVCAARRSRNLAKAPTATVPTPSRPFQVIHIDHKGPLPRSGKYTNILVVTCALTRFTLYIPVSSTSADETLRTLLARVFCVFGYPLVIVSDNGPAFISTLCAEMASYFGYRHVPVLPYSAQANGIAESSVKRIKLLLDRHCEGYADWHKILPLAQLQLNTHVHTGTNVSPYMALFGHKPNGLELLENPSLLPETSTGSEWLREVRARLQRLHTELAAASDKIKEARTIEANSRRHSEVNHRVGPIVPGSYVRKLHGSQEDAAYIRKHGHGMQWKHRYKVLEVKPHAIRLEIPKDGSVPIIGEWQSIRNCEPSPLGEVLPKPTDPQLTDKGIPLSPAGPSGDTSDPLDPDDDEVYEIDKVLRAEKIGNRYKLLVKWRGYVDPTPMWRHDLERQTSNAELLREINEAVQRCKQERLQHPEEEPSQRTADEPTEAGTSDTTLLGRGYRQRSQTEFFDPGLFAVQACSFEGFMAHVNNLSAQRHVSRLSLS
jgi:hypothetical protein